MGGWVGGGEGVAVDFSPVMVLLHERPRTCSINIDWRVGGCGEGVASGIHAAYSWPLGQQAHQRTQGDIASLVMCQHVAGGEGLPTSMLRARQISIHQQDSENKDTNTVTAMTAVSASLGAAGVGADYMPDSPEGYVFSYHSWFCTVS